MRVNEEQRIQQRKLLYLLKSSRAMVRSASARGNAFSDMVDISIFSDTGGYCK